MSGIELLLKQEQPAGSIGAITPRSRPRQVTNDDNVGIALSVRRMMGEIYAEDCMKNRQDQACFSRGSVMLVN